MSPDFMTSLVIVIVLAAGFTGAFLAKRFLPDPSKKADLHDLPDEFVVVDFETNGLSLRESVLEALLVRMQRQGGELIEQGRFHRFYFPVEPWNPQAQRVNGLDDSRIRSRREGADYPEHFQDDLEAAQAFVGDSVLVSHNTDFDLKFFRFNAPVRSICTMTSTCRATNWRRNKISLADAADFWGVKYDRKALHSASADVDLTIKVLIQAAGHDAVRVEDFVPGSSSGLDHFRKRNPKREPV